MREQDVAILTSLGINAAFLRQVEQACESATYNIEQRASKLSEIPLDKAQGFFAEQWHTETFNVDTILQRMRHVSAKVLSSNALYSPDIEVTEHGKPTKWYSLKYWRDGPSSVNAQKGYGEQQRLIPTDQREDAKRYLNRQILKDSATEPGLTLSRVNKPRSVDSGAQPVGSEKTDSPVARTVSGPAL